MFGLGYYDTILLGIAGSVSGGIIVGLFTALGFNVGLFIGSLVATVFLYDAMFRNPPLPVTDPRIATTAIIWHAFLAVLAMGLLLG